MKYVLILYFIGQSYSSPSVESIEFDSKENCESFLSGVIALEEKEWSSTTDGQRFRPARIVEVEALSISEIPNN